MCSIAEEVYREGDRIVYQIKCPRPKCRFSPEGYNKELMERMMKLHIDGLGCKK